MVPQVRLSVAGMAVVQIPRLSPVLLVLVAIASVQIGSSVAKDLFAAASPWVVAWLRLATAAVVLGIVARPRLRGRAGSEWVAVLAYGLVMCAMNVSIYLAISRIPVGMAVTVEFLGPLGVAVAASRRARDLGWVLLAGGGVALLGFTPGDLDGVGLAFALLAGACWAGYILLAGPTGRHWSGVTGVTVGSWVGLAALTPVVLALRPSALASPGVWAQGALVGLLASVVPYGLEMVALRRITPGLFGILMSLEPAAAALAALAVLGERLRPIELVAMACVIAASLGATTSRGSFARAPLSPDGPPGSGGPVG